MSFKQILIRCFAFFLALGVIAGLLAAITSQPVNFNGNEHYGVVAFLLTVFYMAFSSVLWAGMLYLVLKGGDLVIRIVKGTLPLAIVLVVIA